MANERVSDGQKPKLGRKSKSETERRSEKFSIYLTPRIYQGMKTLAALSMQDMSDIFFTLASDFVDRNADKLDKAQDFLENLGAIK